MPKSMTTRSFQLLEFESARLTQAEEAGEHEPDDDMGLGHRQQHSMRNIWTAFGIAIGVVTVAGAIIVLAPSRAGHDLGTAVGPLLRRHLVRLQQRQWTWGDDSGAAPPQAPPEKVWAAISPDRKLISAPTSCLMSGRRYEPLNMPGQRRHIRPFVGECQALCEATPGCVSFSYWPDGGCHLADQAARWVQSETPWMVAGPASCSDMGALCFHSGSQRKPLTMNDTERTVQDTASQCHALCQQTHGCASFAWWPDGGCHLQDATAVEISAPIYVVTGPSLCPSLATWTRTSSTRTITSSTTSTTAPPTTSTSTSGTPTSTSTQTTTSTTTTLANGKLFCFSLMQSWGIDLALMRTQHERNAGIFGCEDWLVLSDETTEISTKITTLIPALPSGEEMPMYENPNLFMAVWEEVRKDGRYEAADWVVKTDPDTVFFPARLRFRVARNYKPDSAVLFSNCAAKEDVQTSKRESIMHGSLEVISRTATQLFFDQQHRCRQEVVRDTTMVEERYISQCLELVGANLVNTNLSLQLLEDIECDNAQVTPDCTSRSTAFHNFSDVDSFNRCWFAAEYNEYGDDGERKTQDMSDQSDQLVVKKLLRK